MKKVTITMTDKSNSWCSHTTVNVSVDGVHLLTGHIGGEPEDNCRTRDYDWIDGALAKLARSLGAQAEIIDIDDTDDPV